MLICYKCGVFHDTSPEAMRKCQLDCAEAEGRVERTIKANELERALHNFRDGVQSNRDQCIVHRDRDRLLMAIAEMLVAQNR